MTLRNRVTPAGEIVAEPWRGALMGNRGRLHTGSGRAAVLGRARWRSTAWVCCVTAFRGRWREPMPEGRWTALFFWDEAAAFAAGHRPCGECRNRDHRRFKAAWAAAGLPGHSAGEIDRALHAARTAPPPRVAVSDLPEGSFVATERGAMLVAAGGLWRWQPGQGGYAPASGPAGGAGRVLTPLPVVEAFRAGYRPRMRLPSVG
ncbi:MAG: hypothetical protein ACFBSD_00005 [Paracoccaceae bacterium]